MGEAGGGEEKGQVSLLQLSPFIASIFPLFPQKRLIFGLYAFQPFSTFQHENLYLVLATDHGLSNSSKQRGTESPLIIVIIIVIIIYSI